MLGYQNRENMGNQTFWIRSTFYTVNASALYSSIGSMLYQMSKELLSTLAKGGGPWFNLGSIFKSVLRHATLCSKVCTC